MQYNTIPYNAMQIQIQHNAIQHNKIQCNAIQCNTHTIQYNTIRYTTVQYNTLQTQYNIMIYQTIQSFFLCATTYNTKHRNSIHIKYNTNTIHHNTMRIQI